MAANSDIRAGVADPDVDFRDTFHTTYNLLRLMREHKIPRLAFASTSAIYGDLKQKLTEDIGPLFPISNYGAMKLASEAAISAAAESFLERAWIFRFPNVVGSRATHGAIFDFIHKLKKNPAELEVLGDGTQEKPYFHVADLIEAMLFITDNAKDKLNFFNIGTSDTMTTVRYLAETTVRHAAAVGENPLHRRQPRLGGRRAEGELFCGKIEKARLVAAPHLEPGGGSRGRGNRGGKFLTWRGSSSSSRAARARGCARGLAICRNQ